MTIWSQHTSGLHVEQVTAGYIVRATKPPILLRHAQEGLHCQSHLEGTSNNTWCCSIHPKLCTILPACTVIARRWGHCIGPWLLGAFPAGRLLLRHAALATASTPVRPATH
jgi:hypothetical protein